MSPLTLLVAPLALLAPATVRQHALELRDRGFTVVHNADLDLNGAQEACEAEFDAHQRAIARLGIDSENQHYSFSEIVTRHQHRLDFHASSASSAWMRLLDEAIAVATPIVEHVHMELPPHPDDDSLPLVDAAVRRLVSAEPIVDQRGCILAQTGAGAQRFHCDVDDDHFERSKICSRHRLYNVFVPLVDIDAATDGTMFWPGSHLEKTREANFRAAVERAATRSDGSPGFLEDDEEVMAQMVMPGCPAGGIVLFDQRLLHRGLPNQTGRDRHMAYAVLATGGARDRCNFAHDLSLHELVAAMQAFEAAGDEESIHAMRLDVREACPTWDEMRAHEDEAERFLHLTSRDKMITDEAKM